MKNFKLIYIIVITISILLSFSQNIFAQSGFECGFTGSNQSYQYININDFWGLNKPIRTDISGVTPEPPSEAYFPVLVVFVAFADDPGLPQWPEDQAPDYLNNFIAQNKSYNSDWWDAYSETTAPLSDYWLEASRGKLHVLGNTYYVQLGNASSYSTEAILNQAIWDDLVNNQNLTDWRPYDLWKPVVVNGVQKFKWEADGYVDMIYKIHKTEGRGPMPHTPGYAHLTSSKYDNTVISVDPFNGVSIKYGYSTEGSGLTLDFTPNKNMNLSVAIHEHGHFLFADGHITYGKVVAGPGVEGYFSPYEMILLGYMSPTTVTFNNSTPHNLKDYSARDNSSGYILKVPIVEGEYFLVTNRSNYSKWDKLMFGDTARIETFDIFSEHDKGIYIHHVNKEFALPNFNEHVQDLECADGVWTHVYDTQVRMYHYGGGSCFDNNMWNVYKRDAVIYDNDLGMNNSPANIGDDKSSGNYMWAWKGQAPQDPCELGLERTFTNSEDYFDFDQVFGDRFDPWKMEYNEVFSPYSSPSTNSWTTNPTNQNSGIFIILRGKENDKSFNIDIYKVGEPIGDPLSLEDILEVTPPSRPMGLKLHLDCDYEEYIHPRITWNHNQEPDMVRQGDVLKYLIQRAKSEPNEVPGTYTTIASPEISVNSTPEFTDNELWYNCGDGNPWISGYVRYRVIAVDETDLESVPSDFVATPFWTTHGDNYVGITTNEKPKQYSLQQNYPNPFNPVTTIKYSIPKNEFVNMKIYDITGREIIILVNEIKPAGYYSVSFDGSNLSSGVYFYKLVAGNFVSVKRMVLIK